MPQHPPLVRGISRIFKNATIYLLSHLFICAQHVIQSVNKGNDGYKCDEIDVLLGQKHRNNKSIKMQSS